MKNVGLYIHIPFCVRKCLYCDFLSGNYDKDVIEKYINTLEKEIMSKSERETMEVDTIYIGGGTPSMIDVTFLDRIIKCIHASFLVNDNAEITIEVNPGTVDYSKVSSFKRMGINRLSIGLQSANDDELKRLGRIYDYDSFLKCYEYAKKAGFDNINIDIMSAIPGQSISDYMETLNEVIQLNPKHISSYSLIIEPDTPYFEMYGKQDVSDECFHKFGQKRYELPSEEDERKMYELTNDILKQNGYMRYEISNYCKEGFESRHNSGYWTGKEYIGFGAGAASYINKERITNIYSVTDYIKKYPEIKEEIVPQTNESEMEEFMFLGLRMAQGVSKQLFYNKFDVSINEIYDDVIKKYVIMGLLIENNERIMLTDKGIDVSNQILADFLLDKEMR